MNLYRPTPRTPRSFSIPGRRPESRLARALRLHARADGAAAARAAAALRCLLAGAAPEDWRGSPLTTDRYPVEVTCAHDGAAFRYAVQVPARSPAARLHEAQRRLAQLGAPALPPSLRARVEALLRDGTASWGAWVGGRHDGARDRFKLYVEAPRGDGPAAVRFGRDYLGAHGPHLRCPLRMVGVDLADGMVELYFRGGHDWPSDLPLARTPAPGGDPLALLAGRPAAAGPRGFSVALSPGGQVAATSLFAFASCLFGGDAAVRRQVLAFARRSGLAMGQYAALTRPLARRARGGACHGLIAVVATGNTPTTLRIGVSPPAVVITSDRRRK